MMVPPNAVPSELVCDGSTSWFISMTLADGLCLFN
jgi:hypothetical protein